MKYSIISSFYRLGSALIKGVMVQFLVAALVKQQHYSSMFDDYSELNLRASGNFELSVAGEGIGEDLYVYDNYIYNVMIFFVEAFLYRPEL